MAGPDILLSVGIDPKQLRDAQRIIQQTFQGVGGAQQGGLVSPQSATIIDAAGRPYQSLQKKVKTAREEITKVDKSTESLLDTFKKAIPRMALWAVGWTTLYSVVRLTLGVIKSMFTTYSQLSDEMAHVMTVTRTAGRDFVEVHNEMRQAVLDYGRDSRETFTDIARVLYHLGSAGLTAQEQMAGFKHVVDLNTASFGQMDQTARLVAGAYRVFGKNMSDAMDIGEKFKRISDILAYTYSNQQVELSELATAFQYAGSVAGLMDIDLMTLTGTIGFLNSNMLKGCFSEDTEILTNKGFKYFKDLDKTELVATLNPDTNELKYQKPIRYIAYDYDGKMYKTKNQHLDLLVTPNHNIYIREGLKRKKTPKYVFKNPEDIFNKPVTYNRGAKWKGNSPKYFELPSVKLNYGGFDKKETGVKKIEIKSWLKFLAYYLSEGSNGFYGNGNGKDKIYTTKIYQYEGVIKDKIRNDIKKLSFKFYENNNGRNQGFEFHSKQLYFYLKNFGKQHERYIPDFIKNLSPKLLKIFILAYTRGDGRIRSKNIEITTSSVRMRDDLQEIGLRAGFAVTYHEYKTNKFNKSSTFKKNYKIWKINFSNRTEFSFDQKQNIKSAKKYFGKNKINSIEKWIDYSDKVYCVEVPKYNIIFVRRNGKIVWSGNSKAGTSMMNAFVRLAQQTDLLKEKFGIVFDPTKPLEFSDVMMELRERIGATNIATEDLRDLFEIFGRRGGRAITTILNDWAEWEKSIGVTSSTYDNFAQKMSDTAKKSLPAAFKRLFQGIQADIQESMNPFLDIVTKIVDKLAEGRKLYNEWKKAIEKGVDYEIDVKRHSHDKLNDLKKEDDIRDKIGFQNKVALLLAKETNKYEMMKVAGFKEEEILKAKISNWASIETQKTSDTQKAQTFLNLLSIDRKRSIEKIVELSKEYLGNEEGALELNKLLLDYKKAQLEEVMRTAEVFKDEITQGIMNAIRESENWMDVIKSIGERLYEMQIEDMLQKFLIEPLWGQKSIGSELLDVAPEAGEKMADSFLNKLAEGKFAFGGGQTGGHGATGTWAENEDGVVHLPKIVVTAKKATDALGGVNDALKDIGEGGKKSEGIFDKLKELFSAKGKGMQGIQGILSGAAMGAAGGMFGLQGGAGAALGGALGLAQMIPGLGQIASVASMIGPLFSMFKKSKKEEEIAQDQTIRITSKIDVTNKELQMVNRNLAGIRRGFEGWIMLPESAYFRERSPIEANFQLSEMRGYV